MACRSHFFTPCPPLGSSFKPLQLLFASWRGEDLISSLLKFPFESKWFYRKEMRAEGGRGRGSRGTHHPVTYSEVSGCVRPAALPQGCALTSSWGICPLRPASKIPAWQFYPLQVPCIRERRERDFPAGGLSGKAKWGGQSHEAKATTAALELAGNSSFCS